MPGCLGTAVGPAVAWDVSVDATVVVPDGELAAAQAVNARASNTNKMDTLLGIGISLCEISPNFTSEIENLNQTFFRN